MQHSTLAYKTTNEKTIYNPRMSSVKVSTLQMSGPQIQTMKLKAIHSSE